MRHLALVVPGLDRMGGAERQAMLLALGMKRRGWRVSFVALTGTDGAEAAELQDAGVSFLNLHMRKGLADPRGWIQFNRWLRRERPAVVHAHLPHAAWLVRWSAAALRVGFGVAVPMVVDTIHSSSTGTMGRRLGYRLSKWIPDRVTAVSEAAAEAHRLAGMVEAERLCVVPNGVDVEAWRPDAEARRTVRAELGMAEEFLWVAVGRLEAVKDYAAMLKAMAQLPEAAQLLIAGKGPLLKELTGMAERLGLERRVRFLGFQADVRRLMQAADGFVLSSRWEGLPMGLIEAGACGLPAVATDVPGTREVLVDGETGRLAPAGDADGLAAAMSEIMGAPQELREAIGRRARARVEENFGLEMVLDRWEHLYGDLAD